MFFGSQKELDIPTKFVFIVNKWMPYLHVDHDEFLAEFSNQFRFCYKWFQSWNKSIKMIIPEEGKR